MHQNIKNRMVFVAIEIDRKNLINANDVSYTESRTRDIKYFCTCCNDKLTGKKSK